MLRGGEAGRGEVRHSAIAGTWYPAGAEDLARTIDGYLAEVEKQSLPGELMGLVVPHAGYAYSGGVAAHAYKLLDGTRFDRVVVLAPSHYPHGGRVLVSTKRFYETPLGLVEVDAELLERVLGGLGSRRVRRLEHDEEHSLEIQLPFLQRTLPDFKLVPLLLEDQTPGTCQVLAQAVVEALAGQRALLVASTDLSHFHSYEEAKALDQACLEDIGRFAPEDLSRDVVSGRGEACGAGPVVAALSAARAMGARGATVLNYANSGDVTGDRWRVVGYGAAAIWK